MSEGLPRAPVAASELKTRITMPLPPADRLDVWLRRQTGWRLAVLFWLEIGSPFIMLCCSAASFFMPGSTGLSVTVVLWSFVASLPVVGLLFLPQRRRMSRRGLPLVPSWRLIVAMMFLLAASLAEGFSQNEPTSHHGRDGWGWIGLCCGLIVCACFADLVRRARAARSPRSLPEDSGEYA